MKAAAAQTRLTTEQVRELNEQTKLARKQGDETARQGKTILVFTMVTIIFVSEIYRWERRTGGG